MFDGFTLLRNSKLKSSYNNIIKAISDYEIENLWNRKSMKSKIYEWTSEVFGFASQGHKLEQMFLNSFQGYIWFISCIFQAFSIIIMESVMGRLLGNPEKRDFFEDQIHDFDHGNSFFILISSLASLFCKFTSMLSHCKMFMINIFQSMHDVRFSVGQLQYTTTLFC